MMVNEKDEIQSPPVVRVVATGKYSSEVLDKKIKKAEKMLDRSTPGSKDFKALQKKLIQYRTQLEQQKQQSDANVAMNGSFSVSESEGKEWPDEQEHGANNIDPLSAEVVEEEVVDENEWKAKEQEDQNSHSLEILKKKLKKVEKMLHKSTPGSKEYKKLQKKRMEYGRKIREQDIVDNITDERNQKHRFQQSEAAGVVRGDTLQHQPRRSYQRYSEAVTRRAEGDFKLEEARQEEFWQLEKKAKELKQTEREQRRTNQSRRFEQEILERKKVEDSIDVNYGEEEKLRKQAYLEEARRLKQEALAKKRKEETLANNKKVEEDKQLKKNSCPLNVLESQEIHSKTSEVNEASKYVIGDRDYQRKKQAYLEEARRLKQEALEKIRKEEELQSEIETQENEEVYEKPSSLDISTARTLNKPPRENETLKCIFVGNDGETKKQTYLEEARQLKKEAMERKRKEEDLHEKTQTKKNEEVKTKDPSSLAISAAEDTQKKNLGEYMFYNENQPKRQAYLEEARSLKQEGISKKLEVEDSVQDGNDESQKAIQLEGGFIDNKIASINASSQIDHVDDQGNNSDLSLKVRSETVTQKEVELRGDSAIPAVGSTDGRTPNFLDEINTTSERKKENGNRDNSSLLPKLPNFLDEIKSNEERATFLNEVKSKGARDKKNEHQYSSSLVSVSPLRTFLEEIKSKEEGEEEEKKNKSTPFSKSDMSIRKPHFLDEIKFKAEERGGEEHHSISVSEEVESAKEGEKEDNQQTDCTQCLDPATHRKEPLDEIKSEAQAEHEERIHYSPTQSVEPATNKIEPNFLDEIKSRRDEQGVIKQKDSTQSSDLGTHNRKPNFLDEIKSRRDEQGVIKQKDSTGSSDLGTHKRKPNFLDEIKSPTEEQEVIKQKDSTGSSDLGTHNRKPNFLDEIKSRRDEQGVIKQKDSTGSSDLGTHKRKPNFLDEIKSRTEEQEVIKQKDSTGSSDLGTHKRKPNFLDEIKSKAEEKKEDDKQNNNTSFREFPSHTQQPNFLEEIKLKAAGLHKDEQQNVSSQTINQISHGKKGNFLQEIRTRVQNQNEEKGKSTCESNVFEINPKTESAEATFQKSEQTDKRRTENVKPQKEEESVAKLDIQQEEVLKGYLDKRTLPEALSNNSKKILRELENNEIQQKKMEQSLMQNGIRVTEEIPYEEAKDKIADITESMRALAAAGTHSYAAEKEYFRLEEQLSKYTTALMLTDEYAEEHQRLEQDWEDSIQTDNIAAIHKLRSHMPINIRHLTEEDLVTATTPNGKTLPRAIARKFKRTNILQLLRVDPDDIEMMHPSLLEGMRTTGLTLTERRALHAHFKDLVGRWKEKRSDPSIEKKWQWYQTLRSKFKETLTSYLRCVEKFGPPGSHRYAKRGSPNEGGCPLLGNQCPIKADAAIDYSDDYGYSTEPRYESSGNRIVSKKTSPKETLPPKEKTAKVTKSSEAEILQEYRDRLCLDTNETEADKKLLRELFHSVKRTKNIEKQLAHAGLSIPKEDISYDVAKTRIAELTEELNEVVVNMGNTSDRKKLAKIEHTFGALSQELDKYTNALMLTKEWEQEQRDKEHQWESEISAANYEALQNIRRHMPVNIRNVSETSLATDLTPNGKVLPMAIVKKFKRTNILMILRTDPSAIEVMHPSSLEAMRTTGLTLTERRAIHEHLKGIAPKWKATTSDKMCERKWMWHASLTSKFKEMLGKYERQGCPIKSDLPFDYSGDYGFPEGAEYEQQIVAKSNLLSLEELEKRKLEDNYS